MVKGRAREGARAVSTYDSWNDELAGLISLWNGQSPVKVGSEGRLRTHADGELAGLGTQD